MERHYGAIKLLYQCLEDADRVRTLDHGVTLEGLKIMDYPAHVNYIIERGDAAPVTPISFRGKCDGASQRRRKMFWSMGEK